MALTLNNFVGFETGGLEEASSTTGTVSAQSSVVKTGNYALSGNGGSFVISPFESISDAGDDQIVGFNLYYETNPGSLAIILSATESGSAIFYMALETDGDLFINWHGTSNETITTPLTSGKWHFIEIKWQHLDSGTFIIYLDGSQIGSYSGKDMSLGGTFDEYELNFPGLVDYVIDDFYCMSGASSVSDFLGPRTEVLGSFQNTAEDATDQGSTLDQGTWAITGDTPGSDDASPAGYESTGAQSGYTICDEGDRDGPDVLITGTIKGGKWLHRLERGSGSGTNHYKRWGKEASLTDTAVTLGIALADFFTISEDTTYVPNVNTDQFSQGMRKDTGGREIYAADIWAFLLHVAPDPSTLDLTDMEFPDQNYHLGPFGT